jgi:hypothetical protein
MIDRRDRGIRCRGQKRARADLDIRPMLLQEPRCSVGRRQGRRAVLRAFQRKPAPRRWLHITVRPSNDVAGARSGSVAKPARFARA